VRVETRITSEKVTHTGALGPYGLHPRKLMAGQCPCKAAIYNLWKAAETSRSSQQLGESRKQTAHIFKKVKGHCGELQASQPHFGKS